MRPVAPRCQRALRLVWLSIALVQKPTIGEGEVAVVSSADFYAKRANGAMRRMMIANAGVYFIQAVYVLKWYRVTEIIKRPARQ